MTNPLVYVGDRTRLTIYLILAIIGLALGATQVGYASIEAAQPDWLTIGLAVYAFLGGGLGFTAATHTGPGETDLTPPPEGYEPRH